MVREISNYGLIVVLCQLVFLSCNKSEKSTELFPGFYKDVVLSEKAYYNIGPYKSAPKWCDREVLLFLGENLRSDLEGIKAVVSLNVYNGYFDESPDYFEIYKGEYRDTLLGYLPSLTDSSLSEFTLSLYSKDYPKNEFILGGKGDNVIIGIDDSSFVLDYDSSSSYLQVIIP